MDANHYSLLFTHKFSLSQSLIGFSVLSSQWLTLTHYPLLIKYYSLLPLSLAGSLTHDSYTLITIPNRYHSTLIHYFPFSFTRSSPPLLMTYHSLASLPLPSLPSLPTHSLVFPLTHTFLSSLRSLGRLQPAPLPERRGMRVPTGERLRGEQQTVLQLPRVRGRGPRRRGGGALWHGVGPRGRPLRDDGLLPVQGVYACVFTTHLESR